MTDQLALIGAGGHAASVVAAMPEVPCGLGYVDPRRDENGALNLGRYLGDDDSFLENCSPDQWEVLITLVSRRNISMDVRRKIIERYRDYRSPVVVASDAVVCSPEAIGQGTVVMHKAVVNVNAVVGPHCIINTGAIVEHDCRLGSNVFIGPGAVVCGGVEIGSDSYIAAGAVIRPGVGICAGTLVGIGSVVVRDIKQPGTYFGMPVRKIK